MITREELLREIDMLENYITPGDQWRLRRVKIDVGELVRRVAALEDEIYHSGGK